jgi:hypothetical protein
MTERPICPACKRPYHYRARVPLDTAGAVMPCRDCREAMHDGQLELLPPTEPWKGTCWD